MHFLLSTILECGGRFASLDLRQGTTQQYTMQSDRNRFTAKRMTGVSFSIHEELDEYMEEAVGEL